ncbi:MAG: pyrimidine/purine nucleoside phosphorylase [Daejeonella sp.]|uniref:pyrimidine/purine nucleoside phosphorylase n=1 Tax=Daejeonella sp. JGW-45 TaxID=3034148 RepID=UPI0023EAC85F|nr:pyrimidine/purine nucleoside phosphorylase [Daejeonella sp. JGW-45]
MITVNEYFDGNVKSLGYNSVEGKSTIGIIEQGEYEFGTSQHETMTVIEGALQVLLPGESAWELVKAGESFEIDAGSSFKVQAERQTSYLCKYK